MRIMKKKMYTTILGYIGHRIHKGLYRDNGKGNGKYYFCLNAKP